MAARGVTTGAARGQSAAPVKRRDTDTGHAADTRTPGPTDGQGECYNGTLGSSVARTRGFNRLKPTPTAPYHISGCHQARNPDTNKDCMIENRRQVLPLALHSSRKEPALIQQNTEGASPNKVNLSPGDSTRTGNPPCQHLVAVSPDDRVPLVSS